MNKAQLRGWVLMDYDMDHLRSVIDQAPSFGINHLQFSHQLAMYAEELTAAPQRQRDINELIARAHERNIESYIWTHEMQRVPAQFFRHGKVNLQNDAATWPWLQDRYRSLFQALPEIDGVILTLTETRYRGDDDNEIFSSLLPAERLAKAINTIYEVCQEFHKGLYVRTFTWVPKSLTWMVEALRHVPDEVRVMSKEAWGDWFQYSPYNSFIGVMGNHPQIMEFDLWGEYAGGGHLPWCYPDYMKDRLRDGLKKGIVGAVGRVHSPGRVPRENHGASPPDQGFSNLSEFNIYTLARLLENPETEVEEIWQQWASERFGAQAASHVISALKRTNDIVQKTFFLFGFVFLSDRHPTFTKAETREHIEFGVRFHSQWNPALKLLGESLLRPTEETVIRVTHEKDEAISLCVKSLHDLEEAKPFLKEADYVALHKAFERALMTARVWRMLSRITLRYRWMQSLGPSYNLFYGDLSMPRPGSELQRDGWELLELADEIEKDYGQQFPLVAPENLRVFWHEVENLFSEHVAWYYLSGLYISSSPAVADLNGDGKLEIVASSAHREIFMLDGEGNEIWKKMTRGERYEYPAYSSPALADLDNDGKLEIIIGAADGRIHAFKANGQRLWAFQTWNRVDSSAAVGDLQGNGELEIVVGSLDGTLHVLNKKGEPLCEYDAGAAIFASPALADLNDDGKLEIVCGALNGKIFALNDGGELLWEWQAEKVEAEEWTSSGVPDSRLYPLREKGVGVGIYSSPAVFAKKGAGLIVVGSLNGKLYGLTAQGEKLWEFQTGGPIYSPPTLVDLNDDGVDEILFGSLDGCLYALTPSGQEMWRFQTGGPIYGSAAAADLNGNGILEIVVGSYDHCVWVLNPEGQKIWSYQTGAPIFSSPAIADVNGDGQPEIIIGSYDRRLYALKTGGVCRRNQILWNGFRSSALGTAREDHESISI